MASDIREYQQKNVAVFREFQKLTEKPNAYLPIELFKSHDIFSEQPKTTFKSSGTTASVRSQHHVADLNLYETLSLRHFENIFGSIKGKPILALLPSYVENGDSSLVYMVNHFIEQSKNRDSGFVNLESAKSVLKSLQNQQSFLFGVSFALLDLSELFELDFPELTIIETGGMKGKRQELTRTELHNNIQHAFPSSRIESEYGMTELLSQAYTTDGQWFKPPEWMRVEVTDISDPFTQMPVGSRGVLAFTDLANVYSCSFIQTRDIGVLNEFGYFKVEGRLDNSDLRGCNLLYT